MDNQFFTPNPTPNVPTPGESPSVSPNIVVPSVSPEAALAPTPVETAPAAPAAAPATPVPIAVPTPTVASAPAPAAMPAAPVPGAPAAAGDVDVIEPEWVEKAEEVIASHQNDPYGEEEAVEKLQEDYLQKRYGVNVVDPNSGNGKVNGS
ncbi:MAG: hypothetical protein NVSMB39_6950 [Candidatus Saccharimonadales bacterium]